MTTSWMVSPKINVTEDERRAYLASIVYATPGNATHQELQAILQNAGFDLEVQPNDPIIDPRLLLGTGFVMVSSGEEAFAGGVDAYAGYRYGDDADLIVNGDMYTNDSDISFQCGGEFAYCGNDKAVCGYFDLPSTKLVQYEIPDDPDLWPKVFFIGKSFTGWIELKDNNMERSDTVRWTAGPDTVIGKTGTSHSGNHALVVITDESLGYAEQMIDPQPVTLNLRGWASGGGTLARPAVRYKNAGGSWIEIWQGTSSDTYQNFNVTIPIGAQGFRLYNKNIGSDVGAYVHFDDIQIATQQIETGFVKAEQRESFRRLVLKTKPVSSWGSAIVQYI